MSLALCDGERSDGSSVKTLMITVLVLELKHECIKMCLWFDLEALTVMFQMMT